MSHAASMARAVLVAASLGVACSDDPQPVSGGGSSRDAGKTLGSSFKNDVAPILAESCALTACHGSKLSNLGIYITYDKAQVYEELKKTSPTFGGGALRFVVAGDPAKSFLLAKMDGEHNKLPECAGDTCGTEMPPGELIAKEKRDAVRAWIENGAKDD